MATITRYVVTDNPDEWGDAPTYDKYREARDEASRRNACVIELEYEYSDSSLVDDFREKPDSSDEE